MYCEYLEKERLSDAVYCIDSCLHYVHPVGKGIPLQKSYQKSSQGKGDSLTRALAKSIDMLQKTHRTRTEKKDFFRNVIQQDMYITFSMIYC